MFLCFIPLSLFLRLVLQKDKLKLISTRLLWGFLYNEYKSSAYFWEFIKILTKVLIIIFVSIYDDFIVIKGILIYVILFFYGYLRSFYKPFEDHRMNSLE
jgi:hypothetical protein